jgi:tetratricopeptide (TPR) repeat protein
LHREVGDISGEIHVLNALGYTKHFLNMLKEAESDAIEGLRIAESVNQEVGILWLVGNLSHLYDWSMGQHEKSLELVQRQLDKALRGENKSLIVQLQDYEAYQFSLFGNYEQALRIYESIFPAYEELMDKGNQANVLSFMGELCAEIGKFEQAHNLLELAIIRCSGLKGFFAEFWVPIRTARVALAEGEKAGLKSGVEEIKQAVNFTRKINSMGRLGSVLLIEACFYLAFGEEGSDNVKKALECTEGALKAIAIEPGYSGMPEQFLFHHSRALRVNGRETEADEYLRKAYERLMMVAGNIQDDDLRCSYLEDIRGNRAIQAEFRKRFGT